jgi:hypothetical protein
MPLPLSVPVWSCNRRWWFFNCLCESFQH